MAAIHISKPGSEFGPCEGECEHIDCAENRATAAAACRLCGEAIGYERAFYDEGDGSRPVWTHATCLRAAVERALGGGR